MQFRHLAAGMGRFRVNAFIQQGKVGMVMRVIPQVLPTIDGLGVPQVLKEVDDVQTRPVHHGGRHRLGQVDHAGGHGGLAQRELVRPHHHHRGPGRVRAHAQELRRDAARGGLDTDSWEIALKNTLRQAPDVILMGEIRDRETMEHAVAFAETGHLCLATLHANSANQALDRIINFFPEERRSQLLMDLSLNLKALVSQRLMPKQDGKGRAAVVEIMLNTPLISDLIFKGEVSEIKEIMKKSRNLGMQTFDQALFDAYENNVISYEDALRNADSLNDLRLQIKLNSQRGRTQDLSAGTENLRHRLKDSSNEQHQRKDLRTRTVPQSRLSGPGRDGFPDGGPPGPGRA
jgi:twitching motility protein PilU